MHNLFDFFRKYGCWFLFVALEVVCGVLLFRFNNYQGSVWFTSANRVSGALYQLSSGVTAYFHLKELNDTLTDRNVALEQEVAALEARLSALMADTLELEEWKKDALLSYRKVKARVINNSLHRADNYITLDKGRTDSVFTEMGVVCGTGVVGVVSLTSEHHALVISLLNSRSSISCKIKGRDYFGYLRWDGKDARYTYLRDLPRHAECHKGDTIVTSGYSTIFPEGIMVGRVEDVWDSNDGLSYCLKVRLSTDFGRLNDVRVIAREGMEELKALEKKM